MKLLLDLIKLIPKGKVTTYKELARVLKSSPRAVGQALKRNKNLVIIPCHRVVMSNGRLGGYAGGIKKKINLLRKEGVELINGRVDLSKHFYSTEKLKNPKR